jgi:exo-1,4-beta-D-glucosaminidase
MNLKWNKEEKLTINEDCYKELFKLPKIEGLSPIYFVKLELKDQKGNAVSDNFYWFSSTGKDDFREIAKMQKVKLDMTRVISYEYDDVVMKVTVRNTSDKLAFFNRLMITKGEGGEEILPTFWSDNFFSLLPGEVKTVTARFAKQDLEGKEPILVQDKDI